MSYVRCKPAVRIIKHCFYFLGWSSKQGQERDVSVETTVRYHKAEVVYHGKIIMASKRCHAWRPEANLRYDGDIVASVYFGMGAQESTGITQDLVFFTRRLSILRAVVTLLENIGVSRYVGDVTRDSVEQAQAMALSVEDSYANVQSEASHVTQPDLDVESPSHDDFVQDAD